jgi:hypothetical protein
LRKTLGSKDNSSKASAQQSICPQINHEHILTNHQNASRHAIQYRRQMDPQTTLETPTS